MFTSSRLEDSIRGVKMDGTNSFLLAFSCFNGFVHIPWQNIPDLPTPPTKKLVQKLLVKGPGYLPGVCGWDLRIRVFSYQTTRGLPATFIPSEGGNPETPCPMVLSLYKVYTILTTPIKPSLSLQPQPFRYYSINLDRLPHQLIWWSFDDWTRTVCYVTLPTGLSKCFIHHYSTM